MRRITSVLDSSYIGLFYWTAWQAPKNIVSSSPSPRSREASPGTPSFVVSVLRGRDGWTDPLLRRSPRLFSSPHPSSMGDLWQYQIALSLHSSSFTPSLLLTGTKTKHRHRCKAWDGQQDRGMGETETWMKRMIKSGGTAVRMVKRRHAYYMSYPIFSRVRWTC